MNRNTVPFDEQPPTVASGVRIGTPAATMRGFDEDDFREVGEIIVEALGDDADLGALARAQRGALCEAAALPGVPRLHHLRRVTNAQRQPVARRPPARPAQALVPARQAHVDRRLPPARPRADAAPHVRGDEGPPDRGRSSRDAARVDEVAARSPGKKLAVCPVLRAGVGMLDGFLALVSGARVGLHRALPRRGDARAGRVLREAADATSPMRDAIVLDPMLATGNSSRGRDHGGQEGGRALASSSSASSRRPRGSSACSETP